MRRVFAPGCALMLYRPELAARLHEALERDAGPTAILPTCCRTPPDLEAGARVVNVCPGCDRRYRELWAGISTISAWELLATSTTFSFPDYGGAEMAIHDACPTRTERRVHEAVRTLLSRMNIRCVEPRHTRTHAACCGDSFFGLVSDQVVKHQMTRRARAMPRHDVVVYCVSCVKSMHIGGRRPRYMVDLLFGRETSADPVEPSAWHAMLDAYIAGTDSSE